MFTSNAKWGSEVLLYNNEDTTIEQHNTKKEAESVCKMLDRNGFGGMCMSYPLKTWVEEIE